MIPLQNRFKAGDFRVACLLFFAILGVASCQRAEPVQETIAASYSFQGQTMGTTWHATVVANGIFTSGDPIPASHAEEAISTTLARVDSRMSTYKADSEISRFARAAAHTPFSVSQETYDVVSEALRIADLSAGAYDPTVMPLVNLWGFGPAERELVAPNADDLAQALEQVDWRGITLSTSDSTFSITRDRDDRQLDLSSVAKGYGVDAAAHALLASGFYDFYLEVGGEVRTHGSSPRGGPWRTGIDTPESAHQPGATLSGVVLTRHHSIATSGDYRNYHEIDGQRISHSIDARTGRPITHKLSSVTVLHPSCMTADALATAVMILGPEEGLKLLENEPQAEGYLILKSTNGFQTRQTSHFVDFCP